MKKLAIVVTVVSLVILVGGFERFAYCIHRNGIKADADVISTCTLGADLMQSKKDEK